MNKYRFPKAGGQVVRRERGFTLIEMLIGIVIMGLAISMVNVAITESVRNQEKMDSLLDIYQLTDTTQQKIVSQLELGETSGTFSNASVDIEWTAQILEEKDEAAIYSFDAGGYTNSMHRLKLYKVSAIYTGRDARRVYEFEHMVSELR